MLSIRTSTLSVTTTGPAARDRPVSWLPRSTWEYSIRVETRLVKACSKPKPATQPTWESLPLRTGMPTMLTLVSTSAQATPANAYSSERSMAMPARPTTVASQLTSRLHVKTATQFVVPVISAPEKLASTPSTVEPVCQLYPI